MINFICVSVNNWEKRRARKQQFMLHLSLINDVGRVLYVEPPLNLARVILFPFRELRDCQSRQRWLRAILFKPLKVSDKLLVFTPLFLVPFSFRIQALYNFNLYILHFFLKGLSYRLKLDNTVLWLYHPLDVALLNWLKEIKCSCFDWAEEWSQYFSELSFKRRQSILRKEAELINKSDIVFTVSRALLQRAKEINPNSYQLLDGTIPELFDSSFRALPADMRDIPSPIIGYSGTISFRVDAELLLESCRALPQCSFVFVGEVLKLNPAAISSLKAQPNMYFLGAKEFKQIPHYLMNFDLCIIPYLEDITIATPTKIFDYLATGLPIVSTVFPDSGLFQGLILTASSRSEFVSMIKEALVEKDLNLPKKRIAMAFMNTWTKRAEEIICIVRQKILAKGLNDTG